MENVVNENTNDLQGRQRYRIQVAGTDLQFREILIEDGEPTGQQLVGAAGFRPAENYGVLQWLKSGDLEPVRLNETVDLREGGVERFIIAETDRAYFFELEGERQEWLIALINGITLKRLAEKDPEKFTVWLEREDQPDEEIEDDQMVDLSGKGLEKF